ncbi:MAG: hypothetical protein R3202_04105 [Candidatus Competibacterales bacterium]|nr:hypothetical protein [Candidatus Competibacterales bacterium]
MQNRIKRLCARALCRLQGHRLYFVRRAPHDVRVFHCDRCKDQFTLCEQRWQRADSQITSYGHGH